MIEQIVYGIIAGISYSLLGWQKKVATKEKVFDEVDYDWTKLAISVIICGIVGGISGYTGQDFNLLIIGPLGIGITKLVSISWKLIRNIK